MAIGAMFQCFPQSVLADPDLQVRGYIAAVKDFEAGDVLEACQRFIQGNVGGHNPAFCPSSAQLCAEVRERRTMRGIREQKQQGKVVSISDRAILPKNHFMTKYKAAE